MNKFLTSNETLYRLARTILQGIIGVIMANLDYIVGLSHFSSGTKALIVALVMAILSPIMSELGKHISKDEDDEDLEDDDIEVLEDDEPDAEEIDIRDGDEDDE